MRGKTVRGHVDEEKAMIGQVDCALVKCIIIKNGVIVLPTHIAGYLVQISMHVTRRLCFRFVPETSTLFLTVTCHILWSDLCLCGHYSTIQ